MPFLFEFPRFDPCGVNPPQFSEQDLAKWAGERPSSDGGCQAAAATAGSSVALVRDGSARFRFKTSVKDWTLCYKHGSDAWVLYDDVTPTVRRTSASEETTSKTQLTRAKISLTVEGNAASYPAESTARAEFEATFLADIARALGEEASRFVLEDLRAGSIIVDFSISPTG